MNARIRIILASFVLGVLIGTAGLNWAIGHHLDKAELEIKRLRANLADQAEKITVLEKKLAARQNLTINEIIVYVNLADEFEKLELESVIKKLLRELKGKQLRDIDPALVVSIVDRRIVETQDHRYRLTVKGTLVSERVIMYVEAKEIRDIPITEF